MSQEPYRNNQGVSSSELPAKLKEARERSGLEQAELAQILGLKSDRAIRYIESGKRRASDQRVADWARATGFPLAWFYRDEAVA